MVVDVKTVLVRPIVPKVICFTLVLLLIWQLISGINACFLFNKMGSINLERKNAENPVIKTNSNVAINTALFGDYVPNNINESDIKQSMLDLTVVGIMYSSNDKNSHVIIRTAGGGEQTFRIGDSLPGGAIIKRITPDGVLIRRNGALESLSLPKNALMFEPPAQPIEFSN